MVTLNPFKFKKSKAQTASSEDENKEEAESPNSKPNASDSTIGTHESSPQSPTSAPAETETTAETTEEKPPAEETALSTSTSSKSKSKRRSSAGSIKKARENADDASTTKRSKSKSRSKKDGDDSSVKKKKKKKDKEDGYAANGAKSTKSKKKKSKKDKKHSKTPSRNDDGNASASGSEDLEKSARSPTTSPKRQSRTKESKAAAAAIVANLTVADSPKRPEPPKTESKPETPAEDPIKTESSVPAPPPPPEATAEESTNKPTGRSSIHDRASIFDNATPIITPGEHFEGTPTNTQRKSIATSTPSSSSSNYNNAPRRMPKGASQAMATGNKENSAAQVQNKIPQSKSADDANDLLPDEDLNDTRPSVKDAMNVFGGKVQRGAAPTKQRSLDVALDVGKLRQAYLNQEEGDGKKNPVAASLTVPSFGKGETTTKGPAMKRSTSGGNMRSAYLKHVSSGDDAEVSPKPGERKSQLGGGNASWSLAKSLGMSSSTPSTSRPSTAAPAPSNVTGSIKNAYLNATQTSSPPRTTTQPDEGPGKVKLNAFAMFDPSLKQPEEESKEATITPPPPEKRLNTVKDLIAMRANPPPPLEREGRSAQPNIGNKRRSNSAGTVDRIKNNPARKFLEAQFAKASQTTGTIGERADAFSATHGGKTPAEEVSTPKAVRRTMNLNALNLATPGKSTSKKPMGPKPKDMKKLLSQGDGDASFADTVVPLLRDRKQKPLVRELCDRIQKADGLPKTRRLSMRDNDLVVSIIRAIQNDPDVKSIIVDGDVAFNTVSSTLLFKFIEALGMNMHLRRLTLKNVQLGNDILYALATAMERNFILEEIDLSFNLFTSEGLANFCQALADNNDTCKKIMLNNQTTPVSVAEEEGVLEAFEGNKRIMYAKVDFNSEDGQDKLTKILHRNKRSPPGPFDRDKRIIELLTFQAERSEAIKEQKEAENKPLEVPEDDWDYMYELAVLFDKYKLKDIVEKENNDNKKDKPKNADSMSKGDKSNFLFGKFKDILDDSLGCFNSDGSFLTAEFISKYLKKTQDTDELVFDFHGQWKLFKRFPVTDPARGLIVTKFVNAIVSHPQMKEFMGINMANTGCGDDFLEELSNRCLADPSLLPNLHLLNFETNFINERGCVALSKVLADPKCLRYLQLIRLENQKGLLTSRAEFAICRSMYVNRSVLVVSLQFRGLLERQQIHSYVARNLDFLRQARQRHYKKTGTGRKRNETELFFDKIASNNPSVKEVKLPGDRKFLSLNPEERIKAAKSFAENTHVTSVNLNGCELDDDFAEALGKALETNKTIEKLSLEGNSLSGTGIKYLLQGLAKNSNLKELRLHKQSKIIATAEEDELAIVLEANQSLTKLGLDLRNQNVQVKVDRKLKMNDQLKRSKDSSDNLNYLFT